MLPSVLRLGTVLSFGAIKTSCWLVVSEILDSVSGRFRYWRAPGCTRESMTVVRCNSVALASVP